MNINVVKCKFGVGGKRNRKARRSTERRIAYHVARGHKGFGSNLNVSRPSNDYSVTVNESKVDVAVTLEPEATPSLNLAGTWDENIARKALDLFEKSGKTQKAFAEQYGFSDSKLRSWKKKLSETQTA